MYNGKKIIHIVSCGMNGEIGVDNSLLWNIPEELKYFKDCTLGHVVMMGRKTYESLPKPLERRVVVRVSRTPITVTKGVTYNLCEHLNTDCIFIAGGSELYKSTEKYVDEVWYTRVFDSYPEADTFYNLPKGLKIYSSSELHKFLNTKSGELVGVQFIKMSK